MAPSIAQRLEASRSGSTYWLYNQPGLDRLRALGKIAWGYSEVLKERGGDTPLVTCRNHRELSLQVALGGNRREDLSSPWHLPEAPLIILRHGGKVDESQKGGTEQNGTWHGREQDLLML